MSFHHTVLKFELTLKNAPKVSKAPKFTFGNFLLIFKTFLKLDDFQLRKQSIWKNLLNPIRTAAVSPRRWETINVCHMNMNERIGLFFLDFSSWAFHQMLIYSLFQYLYKILRNHVRNIGGTLQFWVCSQIWCCLRTEGVSPRHTDKELFS